MNVDPSSNIPDVSCQDLQAEPRPQTIRRGMDLAARARGATFDLGSGVGYSTAIIAAARSVRLPIALNIRAGHWPSEEARTEKRFPLSWATQACSPSGRRTRAISLRTFTEHGRRHLYPATRQPPPRPRGYPGNSSSWSRRTSRLSRSLANPGTPGWDHLASATLECEAPPEGLTPPPAHTGYRSARAQESPRQHRAARPSRRSSSPTAVPTREEVVGA